MINQIEPWIDNDELDQLKRVINSTFVTESTLTKEFEDLTKELTGSRYAIAMTNGTVAMFCNLKALDIGPGDEVIVPDMTFIATANSVIMAGAKPVFCDIYTDTLAIDVEMAKSLITKKTKAICPVHLYGGTADLDKLKDLCSAENIYLIEDAAQGVGVKYNNRHVGTFGINSILSYYGNKTITCAEGGVILTNDDDLAKKCYRLKNHGRDQKGVFKHEHIGFNFAFTEMQAAIGISQMNKLDRIIKKKKQIHDLYVESFSEIEDFTPQFFDPKCTPVHWFTSFFTNRKKDLIEYLLTKDIQTRQFFYPLHMQPCCQKSDQVISRPCPNSKNAYDMGISLPSSYNLSENDQQKVIKEIRNFFS